MKALVVYDSVYGNTERIAKAIAEAMGSPGEVEVLRAGEANSSKLESLDLLIVGSPTHGGRPTPAIRVFLSKIPTDALRSVAAASFDIRFSAKDQGVGIRMLMRIFGYAAGRIAYSLKRKGAYLAKPPEGFIVEGKEGPLKQGELGRAAAWARGILREEFSVGR